MKRTEVAKEFLWDLSHMYESDEKWTQCFEALKAQIGEVAKYQGSLGDKQKLLECLRTMDTINRDLEMLFVYAHCKRDENTKENKYTVMYGSIMTVYTQYMANISFIEPELTALDAKTLEEFIADPDFKDYDYFLSTTLKSKPHILSENEERLMAMIADFSSGFSNIFTMIDNADIDTPEMVMDGETVKLTHGTYSKALQNKNREVRREAFEKYYTAYSKHINTLAANYNSEVKKNVFNCRARKFDSCLQMVLEAEDVPGEVYKRLVACVSKNISVLHDYIAFRKQILNLDQIGMFDLYVPIFEGADLSVEFTEASKIVTEALKPLGKAYTDEIASSFKNGWIDVYETENKRSGGYCTSAYAAPHPYILLNYSKTTHDVFTLAHELGHAMHSAYSAKTQPVSKADYKIFVAEVASTVNEMLLLDHLMKTVTDDKIKKYLLSYKLDTFRTTIFRQTMFSEFELFAHTTAEKGEPLTVEGMSEFYGELNKRYYSDKIQADEWIKYEWARIPHFYRCFYVYKYATGLISAINISNAILKGEQGALDRYMTFLSSGGCKSPFDILKDAGVDLTTDKPYTLAMEEFKATLDQLTKLCSQD